jgi:DNA/RNA-binding domain of Phe-tRNA-synthetase-like protein
MAIVTISEELQKVIPFVALACIRAKVVVQKYNAALWEEIDIATHQLPSQMDVNLIADLPEVKGLRDAYRVLGKDPARYRGSAEALLRRVLSGKAIYQINSVVDINNLVSLETRCSVGSYDLDRLKSPISFRVGLAGESYKGIGKEIINIENLPVFSDIEGAFGSPTSDSERAMIRNESRNILMILLSFSKPDPFEVGVNRAMELLERFSAATNITCEIIK